MHTQQYNKYTSTQHATWFLLFNRQMGAVKQYAYKGFAEGISNLGFSNQSIPNFDSINHRLFPLTGWRIYAVPGLIENQYFFEQMHEKKFGATTWIRKPEQVDYLEEPDMFHDVFGHIPLLADTAIAEYLFSIAGIANRYINNEEVIEAIARLYWYTIEFGLVRENGKLKIYGAGILSSIAETEFCFSNKAVLKAFDAEEIINTPYIKDSFQQQYYVLQSFADLEKGIVKLEKYLRNKFAGSLSENIRIPDSGELKLNS